jgi:hypothetical protein
VNAQFFAPNSAISRHVFTPSCSLRTDAGSRPGKPCEPARRKDAVTVARRVTGGLLVVTGAVWLGQGLGLIHGSSMTGSTFWAVVGAASVVAGLGLLSWPWRQQP